MIAVFEVGALVVEASIRHFHYKKEKSNKYLGLYYPTWTCGLTMEEEMQTEYRNAETEKSRDGGRDLSSAWSWESLLITPTLTSGPGPAGITDFSPWASACRPQKTVPS